MLWNVSWKKGIKAFENWGGGGGGGLAGCQTRVLLYALCLSIIHFIEAELADFRMMSDIMNLFRIWVRKCTIQCTLFIVASLKVESCIQ